MAGRPTGTPSAWAPPASFDEYEIIRALGGGTGGRVYLAHDTLLDRAVAIKFLLAPLDAAVLARFLGEARAAARIQHPNVATLYRVGQLAQRPYLVSEYVRGRSLEQHPRPVPWDEAQRLALAIARGLAAAHRAGVLHRDISPKNVVVSDTGEVKLVDFGLAQIGEPVGSGGAPSPAGRAAGPGGHAPVRGAGALARRAGLAPRRRLRVRRAGLRAVRGAPSARRRGRVGAPGGHPGARRPSLRALVPGVNPLLSDAVDRCLRRDPAERFASAEELRDALEAVLAPTARGGRARQETRTAACAPSKRSTAACSSARRAEIQAVTERLRSGALVVVAGDSGVGKSSLCAAGVSCRP